MRYGGVNSLGRMAREGRFPTPMAADADRTSPTFRRGNPTLLGTLMLPTPTVKGNNNRKGLSAKSGDGLATAVKRWTTPKARDGRNGGSPAELRRNTPDLNTQVRMYPTPVVSTHAHNRSPSPGAETRLSLTGMAETGLWPTPRSNKWGPPDSQGRIPVELAGGLLNPRWVEWLMGIPIGWTKLQPLETESYLLWLRSF